MHCKISYFDASRKAQYMYDILHISTMYQFILTLPYE